MLLAHRLAEPPVVHRGPATNRDMTRATTPPSALALIGDSRHWLARSLESVLAPIGCAVVSAEDGQTLLRHARETSPVIVISAADLIDMDAVGLCAALRDDRRLPRALPIIVVSATPLDRRMHLQILRAGAWQVLSQPLDPEVFVTTVASYLTVKATTDEAESRALLDRDAGLYNVRGVLRRSHELFAAAVRKRRPLACLVVSVAPTMPGTDPHRDRELQDRMGRILRGSVRASDVVGRIGGSEIVVLAPDTTSAGARLLAGRLAEAVRTLGAPQAGAACRVHIGGCVVSDVDGPPVEATELLVRAMAALNHTQTARAADSIRFHDEVPFKIKR